MPSPQSPRPPLSALIALAVEAGRAIMDVRDAGVSAERKADGSPVTQADRRAEAIILKGLATLAPDIPVLAEEESAAGRVPTIGARFFCVDPLDGTRDFLEASGEFTVNIALIEERTPQMGVIFAPALGVLYAGEPGGAFKATYARSGEATAPLSPIRIAMREGRWRVTVSRRSTGKRTQAFIAELAESEIVPVSSSAKFGLIAEGAADLYPRFGEVSEWDAAAGHAILAAAGGGLMRLNGEPVLYGAAERRFLIDGFVAYGGPPACAATRRALQAFKTAK